jgi:CHAT domain-containing protein
VLSACGSGQAEVIKGDELLGLSRAFLHAGAGALLASLWSVSDQGTRLLLDGFYRASRAGAGPAAALRKAIRTVRADPRFAHPFFWAAFEAIGG